MIKRIVPVTFWSEPQILEEYTPEDKLFHLYLMTNQYSTQIGMYKLNKIYIVLETGLDKDQVDILLDRFEQKFQVISYNHETHEISLLHSLTYSIIRGGKPVLDLLNKEIETLKDPGVILATYHAMKQHWLVSKRSFDKDVMTLFENELARRNVPGFVCTKTELEANSELYSELNTESYSETNTNSDSDTNPDTNTELKTDTETNQKQIYKNNQYLNHKQNLNHNQNLNHKHNDNHKQESYHESYNESYNESSEIDTNENDWRLSLNNDERSVLTYYEQSISEISHERFNMLVAFLETMTAEVIIAAIELSLKARHPYKYCLSILLKWRDKDIQHLGDLSQTNEPYQTSFVNNISETTSHNADILSKLLATT